MSTTIEGRQRSEAKRRLLLCLVSIEAARWESGARYVAQDGDAQIWEGPSGRRWRVWYDAMGHRNASPEASDDR